MQKTNKSVFSMSCLTLNKVLLGLLALAFSGFAGAVGNLIECINPSYETAVRIAQENPTSRTIYNAGINGLCEGKIQAGMAYIQRASDMGHVQASNTMFLYYETDGSFNSHQGGTQDQRNFDAAIHYLERTVNQIESAPDYPEGVNIDQPNLEKKNHVSVHTFITLPNLYYTAYARAIGEIINSSEKLIYTDSINVLSLMQSSANRCLRRPALSVWRAEKRAHLHRVMQVKCQARRDFATQALVLEQERIQVSRECSGPLGDCQQHQEIVSELIHLSNIMADELNSISL